MNIKEFYAEISGNYQGALGRMMKDALVQRFALKFQKDPSFDELKRHLEAGDKEEAFRAAHTLKGVCKNLAFTKLGDIASEITERLREGDLDAASALFPAVQEQYERTIAALAVLESSANG